MRIALLSPCAVAVPPRAYGGTELIIAELARTLKGYGHEVTVFATGDSSPEGELRSHFARPVWPPDDLAELRHSAFAWRSIMAERPAFDVVHAHQAPAIAFSSVCPVPTVVTIHHERMDRLYDFYRDFPAVTKVAISARQAQLSRDLGITHVVHHGLDVDRYAAGSGEPGWLAFVGRFAPEKGPDIAIDVATALGIHLRLGGKPHWANSEFFDLEIKPRLEASSGIVTWHGEVTFGPKLEMLQGARATLFPIAWEEPFGLVMIESMLVGTPVVAFARGAAAEVVEDGVTGFLVNHRDEMIDRVRRIGEIDRTLCRARARERFNAGRMARDYEAVYADAMAASRRASSTNPNTTSGVQLVAAAAARTAVR